MRRPARLEQHDQLAESTPVGAVADDPHHCDDLLDRRRISQVLPTLVARRVVAVIAGHWRAAVSGDVEKYGFHSSPFVGQVVIALLFEPTGGARHASAARIPASPTRGSMRAGRSSTASRCLAWRASATSAARSAMSSAACESLRSMLRAFDAQLEKGDNPGAWTCVVIDDVPELFGTRGLVKIRGAIDGEPFTGALMAQGDGTHRLPVKAALRKTIGKEAGDTVHVRIDERIG